ncbi:hypothetical protein BDEG_21066 [Batrachochytrium dendrobatidis JEL423]|uniref:Uncharacterized protein n=1 Tax=Batrachochytrium dendrobatidis (strain JEL423) TaxID=403673 RepID=A0A177WB67_BATDL|nr:hypothetical protein BDEG_21066 [Batrachochytrium dendrobatidis JEL423]
MGDTLTLLSVHTDLEHAVTLASQAKVKEALDLCSSVMEVVCTHIEILGLVDPDEPGSPHSPTTEKAAALLLGGFDRLGSETTSKPSTTAHPKTAAVNHSQHNNKVLDSESTAKSNSHVKGDLANTNTGTHSFSWATQGSDLMPLTVAHRIEFWQQVNSTWLLAIRCAGTSTEMDLLRQDTTVFTGSRRGSRSRSIRGSKASATAAAADAASTAHALNLSTATANGLDHASR